MVEKDDLGLTIVSHPITLLTRRPWPTMKTISYCVVVWAIGLLSKEVSSLSTGSPRKQVVSGATDPLLKYHEKAEWDRMSQDVAPKTTSIHRRALVTSFFPVLLMGVYSSPAVAATDCFEDCLKNCKTIAPKDPEYCRNNCVDYCEQDNRTDGLSGSVSAEGGEVGILGGTFGQGTVPKGKDKVREWAVVWLMGTVFAAPYSRNQHYVPSSESEMLP